MNQGETSNSSFKTANDLLFFYINNANLEMAYALLKEGEVNLEMKSILGMTPLHVYNYIKLACNFGADPNCRKEYKVGYETPLILASQNNNFEIAKSLIDFGADPTTKDSSGLNCLHHAAKNGNLEISILLISRGCDPNIRDDFGNNASYWAKKNNKTDLLKYLPPPLTVLPLENKEYRDDIDLYKFELSLEEKKKGEKGKGKGK